MCGLCGIFYGPANTCHLTGEAEHAVRAMTETLLPRGPDGSGYLVLPQVALGHRRLSIIDLTDAGAQPMCVREGGPVLAYNGEVYNFRELRQSIDRELAISWYSTSDTEVILRAYDLWGLAGLRRLEGIFALALWDPIPQRLVLMRDRLGVKPLYFAESRLGLAFGSEIKAVLAAGGVDTRLDDQSLREYLWYGTAHEDRTFYRGVRQVMPGHWLIQECGNRRVEAWFKIEDWLNQSDGPHTFDKAVPAVVDAIDYAVARQLVADVPVGLFLSGGLDSSTLAASAVVHGTRPETYTATFEFGEDCNELDAARRVAAHLGLPHHHLEVRCQHLWDVLERLARAHDEPFADAANIPLFLMADALSGSVKVVLQGDGGDELFAGYRRYAVLRNARWWKLWPTCLSPLVRGGGQLARRFVRMADAVGARDPALRMALLLTTETPHKPPERLFAEDRLHQLAETTDPFMAYRHAARRFSGGDPVQQMLLTDLTVQLPSQFLPKVDRATMAAGIEARVPLLDDQLARLVVGMPSQWKARGTEKKALLRAALQSRLPAAILDAPKRGLTVPIHRWLNGPLRAGTCERLLDPQFLDRFGLCASAVGSLLTDGSTSGATRTSRIWRLLQLSLW